MPLAKRLLEHSAHYAETGTGETPLDLVGSGDSTREDVLDPHQALSAAYIVLLGEAPLVFLSHHMGKGMLQIRNMCEASKVLDDQDLWFLTIPINSYCYCIGICWNAASHRL